MALKLALQPAPLRSEAGPRRKVILQEAGAGHKNALHHIEIDMLHDGVEDLRVESNQGFVVSATQPSLLWHIAIQAEHLGDLYTESGQTLQGSFSAGWLAGWDTGCIIKN